MVGRWIVALHSYGQDLKGSTTFLGSPFVFCRSRTSTRARADRTPCRFLMIASSLPCFRLFATTVSPLLFSFFFLFLLFFLSFPLSLANRWSSLKDGSRGDPYGVTIDGLHRVSRPRPLSFSPSSSIVTEAGRDQRSFGWGVHDTAVSHVSVDHPSILLFSP